MPEFTRPAFVIRLRAPQSFREKSLQCSGSFDTKKPLAKARL
jgi:hypothetical protein